MSLKMKPAHVQYLRDTVLPYDSPQKRALYKAGKFDNADKTKDVNMRYRWDLLWLGIRNNGNTGFLNEVLYSYLDDSHIDSALKYIVRPL